MKKNALAVLFTSLLVIFLTIDCYSDTITLYGPAADDVDTEEPTLIQVTTNMSGIINDLNVWLDFEATNAAFDNTVIITHLDTGSSAVLWYDAEWPDEAFDDVNDTTFDDEAVIPFTAAPTYMDTPWFHDPPDHDYGDWEDIVPGSYSPATALSIFDGEDIFGTWQLSIQNTGCCTDEGDDLWGWSIIANISNSTAPVPEPTTLLLFSAGIATLTGIRRRKTTKTV